VNNITVPRLLLPVTGQEKPCPLHSNPPLYFLLIWLLSWNSYWSYFYFAWGGNKSLPVFFHCFKQQCNSVICIVTKLYHRNTVH